MGGIMMNSEERQQNMGRIAISCNSQEELDELARQFNHIYKMLTEHFTTINEIIAGNNELAKRLGLKVGYVNLDENKQSES